MSDYLNMWIVGTDASGNAVFHIAGDAAGEEGVELGDKPQRFFDAPASTFWTDTGFRQVFQGMRYKRRDPMFVLNIFSPTDDPDDWHDIDSQLRMALGTYRDEFTLYAETSDGIRSLRMRLLEEPKAYEQGSWEGKDNHLYAASTLAVSAAASTPFWAGQTLVQPCTFANGSGTQYVPVQNLGDVEVWLRWNVPAPCTVTLPDRSWGSDQFGRATQDANRTWTAPQLYSGENTLFNSIPDMPLAIASNGAPVRYRCNGSLIYPVAPHTPPTLVPVTMTGGPSNATVYVQNDQWYSRPWGVSR